MPSKKRAKYNGFFYETHMEESIGSAIEVVPALIDLIAPESVIDIGCGRGAWLKVFKESGVPRVLGVDGEWVDKKKLLIDNTEFLVADLKKPFSVEDRFDLVLSLEVAEHIPPRHAESFIKTLAGCGDVIAFSAAIPLQWGSGHVNEQWPEYWAKIFGGEGYLPVDCIRRRIWNNRKVEYYYAQNIVVYAKEEALRRNKKLLAEYEKAGPEVLPLVHPRKYMLLAKNADKLVRLLPHPLLLRLRKRFMRD